MGLVKNYTELATSPARKIVLDLIEAALFSIQPENVFESQFHLSGQKLLVMDKSLELSDFDRVFLLGFGKGSAKNCLIIERILGDKLAGGFCIDVSREKFSKVAFTLGTHPLPSQGNIDFTNKIKDGLGDLTGRDLVLVVTCGGGSALLEFPVVPLEVLKEVNSMLLKSGANIHDMNVVRKHLSKVKGGGLAQIVFPARVVNLIFSDVPGNDTSVIASGPLVLDPTTKEDAVEMFKKYGLFGRINVSEDDFVETPKDSVTFKNVDNLIFLSNQTALSAMQAQAKEFGIESTVLSDHYEGEAKVSGKSLIKNLGKNGILLVGGETTVKVKDGGEGGRNQELVLAALSELVDKTIIASFDSDGWDNSLHAGAIADFQTVVHARDLNLDPQTFLNRNDSFNFFKQVGDGIETGRLPSNVSDLMIVYRYD